MGQNPHVLLRLMSYIKYELSLPCEADKGDVAHVTRRVLNSLFNKETVETLTAGLTAHPAANGTTKYGFVSHLT